MEMYGCWDSVMEDLLTRRWSALKREASRHLDEKRIFNGDSPTSFGGLALTKFSANSSPVTFGRRVLGNDGQEKSHILFCCPARHLDDWCSNSREPVVVFVRSTNHQETARTCCSRRL